MGINHKLDIFGILVMSVITAVGGGIFRDLLLGATPPTALKSPFFIVISIIASIVAMLVALIIKSRREALSIFKAARFYNNLLLVSDAIGLGIFTVLGIDAGIVGAVIGGLVDHIGMVVKKLQHEAIGEQALVIQVIENGVVPERRPAFIHYLGLLLRIKILTELAHDADDLALPGLQQRGMFLDKIENVLLGLARETARLAIGGAGRLG